MAEGDGEGVARVPRLSVAGEVQGAGHHERDLLLVRPAATRDLYLDRSRGEGEDGQPGLRAGQEHDPADVAEDEGALRVRRVEEVLHGEALGAQALDERGHAFVDAAEPVGQG